MAETVELCVGVGDAEGVAVSEAESLWVAVGLKVTLLVLVDVGEAVHASHLRKTALFQTTQWPAHRGCHPPDAPRGPRGT